MFNKMTRMILLCMLFTLLILFIVPWLRFAAFIISVDGSFAKQDIMISPLYLGYLITLVSAPIAYLLSMSKSQKSKYRIWGIIILPISLPLAYSVGITYSFIVGTPWATIVLLPVFSVLFIAGIILLLVGIFKNNAVSQL